MSLDSLAALLPDDSLAESAEPLSSVVELRHCWLTERGAPELLFYEEEIVAACQKILAEQRKAVEKTQRKLTKSANASSSSVSSLDHLVVHWQQLEISRLEFLLNSYQRCRLFKIERDCIFLIATREQFQRLSGAEQTLARRYCDLVEFHLQRAFLSGLPESFQSLVHPPSMISQPDLDRFIAFQVVESLGIAEIDSDQEIDLQAGRVFLGQYRLFKDLLFQEKIRII